MSGDAGEDPTQTDAGEHTSMTTAVKLAQPHDGLNRPLRAEDSPLTGGDGVDSSGCSVHEHAVGDTCSTGSAGSLGTTSGSRPTTHIAATYGQTRKKPAYSLTLPRPPCRCVTEADPMAQVERLCDQPKNHALDCTWCR